MLIDEEAVLRPRGDRTHNDLGKRLHAPRREVWRARPREVWVAKHAVVGLTRALAVDLGIHGITVNAICPGPIVTGMTEFLTEDMRNTFAKRRTAVRRYGDPEEVAHMILSLALPAASFITGAIIPVDGGLTVKND